MYQLKSLPRQDLRNKPDQKPVIQPKLKVGQPEDKYEQEADAVADRVMRMSEGESIRMQPIEEEEEMLQPKLRMQPIEEEEEMVQTKSEKGDGYTSQTISEQIKSSKGNGSPLPSGTNQFMSNAFGSDFSHVRIHTDNAANIMNKGLGAKAFTYGSDIFFNVGEFSPESFEGNKLLAHELTHTIQQNQNIQPFIQCTCNRPPRGFSFQTSGLGQRIIERLGRIKIADPENEGEFIPQISPNRVIEILNLSPCFLYIASRIERLYFGNTPQRTPELELRFHRNSAIGSHFSRSDSRIYIETTTLDEVVGRIVHEVVHAWHSEPTVSRTPRSHGSVTRYEEAMIREEARTRAKENEIMQQIYDAGGLQRSDLAQAGQEDVRNSFKSGFPKLTYQEYFIIEEMKRRTYFSAIIEANAVRAANQMIDTRTVDSVRPGNRFEISETTHRTVLARQIPSRVPTLDEAERCVRFYWANRGLRQQTSSFYERLEAISPGGAYFILRYYSRFGIDRQDPRSDRFEHRSYMSRIIHQMDVDLALLRAIRTSSQAFIDWLVGIPENRRVEARGYFNWILIQEKMSREWRATSSRTPNPELRLLHLNFLGEKTGSALSGISVPESP